MLVDILLGTLLVTSMLISVAALSTGSHHHHRH